MILAQNSPEHSKNPRDSSARAFNTVVIGQACGQDRGILTKSFFWRVYGPS